MVQRPEQWFQVEDDYVDHKTHEARLKATRMDAMLREFGFIKRRGEDETHFREAFEEEFGMTPEEASRAEAPRVERAVPGPASVEVADAPPQQAAAKKSTAKAIREGKR